MRADFANPSEQGGKSCRIAITGMSCFIPPASDLSSFWQNLFSRQAPNDGEYFQTRLDNREQLVKLASAALADAGISEAAYADERAAIIISTDHEPGANVLPAAELSVLLGLPGNDKNVDFHAQNPLKGLAIAANKLKSGELDLVLLILAENQNDSAGAKCFGAFVLKRLEEVTIEKERTYASLTLIEEEEATHSENLASLQAIYKEAQIQPSSIGLLTLGTRSSTAPLELVVENFTKWFTSDRKQPWCSLRTAAQADKVRLNSGVALLIETILALQQRMLLPTTNTELKLDLRKSPFYLNAAPRPWLHPQIHAHFAQMNPTFADLGSLRRAALHFIDQDEHFFHLLLEECADINETKQKDFKPDWQSEVFTLFALDRKQLFHDIESIQEFLRTSSDTSLKDLAFTVNSWTKGQIDQKSAGGTIRVAFVSTSVEDLQNKLKQIARHCLGESFSMKDSKLSNEDIYWSDESVTAQEIAGGKLAFVLPGLGAAYPDMLKEMCMHFPEVRAIFDFIDHLAASSGDQLSPSDRIFSRQYADRKSTTETPASLAVMDSAVVAVLMAEWAIYTLLLNLGITPDILLGCSTGEFAALTMSGVVDILRDAPVFYHLSTGVNKSLPIDRLINLRSLKINAALEAVEQQLLQYQNSIFLSADLSPKQLLVTGNKESINFLAKSLEENKISADFLPFAIPYHTSLVAGVVSADIQEVQDLPIDKPMIESWSCSLAAEYPTTASQIRSMTTDLFSKPILFRKSIEALYAKGVRKFVEVGPRGNLAPIISETLESRPHLSLPANRADVSALTQLNHLLANLFVNNLYMDVTYLYQRRSPVLLPIFDDEADYADIFDAELVGRQFVGVDCIDPRKTGGCNPPLQSPQTFNLPSIDQFRQQLLELEQKTLSALKSANHSVALPGKCQHYINNPTGFYLSEDLSLSKIFDQLDLLGSEIICRQVLETELPLEAAALLKCADYILTPSEMTTFQSFKQLPKRKQWLSGRLTVKEAVRAFLAVTHKANLSNAEIEIASTESGKIYVNKLSSPYPIPVISLSHKDGKTIAVAADHSIFSAIGIDLESTDPVDTDMPGFVLSENELALIQHLPQEERNLNFKKLWAAKEAAAKALGLGLVEYWNNLTIVNHDANLTHLSATALIKQITSKEDCEPVPVQTVEFSKTMLNSFVTTFQDKILAFSYLAS